MTVLVGRAAGRRLAVVCCAVAVLSGAIPASAGAPQRVPADAPAADVPVGELLTEFQSLHGSAGRATAAYRATARRLDRQRAVVRRLGHDLARTRAHLADGRDDAGRLAREQYRDVAGGLSPYMRTFLSDDWDQALAQRQLLRRAVERRAAAVERLTGDERRLGLLERRARKALKKRRALAARKRLRYRVMRDRLEGVERLLASLSADQLARLRALDPGAAERAW